MLTALNNILVVHMLRILIMIENVNMISIFNLYTFLALKFHKIWNQKTDTLRRLHFDIFFQKSK